MAARPPSPRLSRFFRTKLRRVKLVWPILGLSLVACGDEAKAPVPIGFTGKCELSIPRDRARVPTADQLKSKVVLRITKDAIVGIHVEVPDNRHSEIGETADHALATGDAAPNVLVDRGGDVDVPMQLRGAGEPWDVVVRVRFRDEKAEVVAGLMIVTGPCVVATDQPK
jgi:hypothetical protein